MNIIFLKIKFLAITQAWAESPVYLNERFNLTRQLIKRFPLKVKLWYVAGYVSVTSSGLLRVTML